MANMDLPEVKNVRVLPPGRGLHDESRFFEQRANVKVGVGKTLDEKLRKPCNCFPIILSQHLALVKKDELCL